MRHLVLFSFMFACAATASAQNAAPQPGQVLVSGTVPDEASKTSVLAKLREVYGPELVVDQISVGGVSALTNWNGYVQKLITPELKQITRGQLKIDGNTVSLMGDVANEAQRQKIASSVATSLNSTYTVNNGLRVTPELPAIDTPGTIEFESGKAVLTPSGRAILDEMKLAILKFKGRKVDIIGHTDNQGLPAANHALSQARAEAVKAYLASQGIKSDLMSAFGEGADRPVASNDNPVGRARNRRIEFRLAR